MWKLYVIVCVTWANECKCAEIEPGKYGYMFCTSYYILDECIYVLYIYYFEVLFCLEEMMYLKGVESEMVWIKRKRVESENESL